jgi:DNA-binding CsgD family transcriptional regulator
MRSSRREDDVPDLRWVTRADGFASRVHEVLREVGSVPEPAGAVDLLARGVRQFGGTAGCFISFVREADTAATCRMLLACDPRWGTDYLVNGWFDIDPWLSHALRSEEPVVASALPVGTPAERAMVERAAEYGFRSVGVAPSPSAAGVSRVGVLYMASERVGFFEGEGFEDVRPLAQALSMELHAWWLRMLRQELGARVRLSQEELALLRHEDSGHGSKAIARVLGTQAKTIDCRFQRINAKLGAPNRKAAVRIAKLYGLL